MVGLCGTTPAAPGTVNSTQARLVGWGDQGEVGSRDHFLFGGDLSKASAGLEFLPTLPPQRARMGLSPSPSSQPSHPLLQWGCGLDGPKCGHLSGAPLWMCRFRACLLAISPPPGQPRVSKLSYPY